MSAERPPCAAAVMKRPPDKGLTLGFARAYAKQRVLRRKIARGASGTLLQLEIQDAQQQA
jgi:hypothetical protein